ncbi:hypothetical protein [Frankia sp. CiP3]|uniref:hypothetical protein n=1 Tax=Frankia sp. CiP3 TaxID=2880971 RepID=UPI001EF6CCC7|nr:hypothetical protein [Frankia sp. CiP3]
MRTSLPAHSGRVRIQLRTLGLGLVCVLLGLTANSCGNGKGPAPVATGTEPVPPTQQAAARTSLHADDYVLTEGPETTGFGASTSLDNRGALSVAAMTSFASCMGEPTAGSKVEPLDSAKGPYFATSDSQMFMGSVAAVYPAEVITAAVRVAAEASFPSCVGQLLKREYAEAADLPAGSTFTVVSASAHKPPPGITAATRVKATMTLDGPPVPMTFDLMFMFSGQIQSSFVVGRVFDDPDQAVVNRVARQIARKAANQ